MKKQTLRSLVVVFSMASAPAAWAQYAPGPEQQTPPQQPYPQQPQEPYPQQPQQPYPQQPPQQPYPQQPPQQPYPQQPYPQQPYPQQPYPQQPPGYPPYAQQAYGAPPGYHEHDGFFFRTTLGLGGASSNAPASATKFSGLAGSFSLALGGAIAPNVILYGEMAAVALVNPEEESPSFVGTANDVSVTTSAIGFGFAYYIMPTNMYVSGSFMFNTLAITLEGEEVERTKTGLGLGLKVGKEWWVTDNWGLGVFGGLDFARMGSDDNSVFPERPTWTTTAFTLGFSATYN